MFYEGLSFESEEDRMENNFHLSTFDAWLLSWKYCSLNFNPWVFLNQMTSYVDDVQPFMYEYTTSFILRS